jgi:NAD-dependent SIR2 family protein deacetylase
MSDASIAEAARRIAGADALLVTAGAGMGVDSGLPDFRGDHGFWKAYPPYAKLGLSFVELANPRWFATDPELAWGFYGHRLNLYRATKPHSGFDLLARWGQKMRLGPFVFTSNVDGQFQKADLDAARIVECHGTIETWQCAGGCGAGLFAAPPGEVAVDATSLRALRPLPSCPSCHGLARPNVLMFGDGEWDATRTEAQEQRMLTWLSRIKSQSARLVIVECGAGSAVPTVRMTSERLARDLAASLIRINPREPVGPAGTISIAAGARDALVAMAEELAG